MIPAINVPAAPASVSNQALQFRETCADPWDEPRLREGSQEEQGEEEGEEEDDMGRRRSMEYEMARPVLVEKTLIIHRDEHGFGLRLMGSRPAYVEHVHENGAAWRAGVRALDKICKVNGRPVEGSEHKDVVLMFKACTRFVALTLFTPAASAPDEAAAAPPAGVRLSSSSMNKLLAPDNHHHNLHPHRPHSFTRFHSNNSSSRSGSAMMASLLASSGASLRRGAGGCVCSQQQARRSESVSASARPHYLTVASNSVNVSASSPENRAAPQHQQLCVGRERVADDCHSCSQLSYLQQPSMRQRAYGSLRGDLNSATLSQHHNHKPPVEIRVLEEGADGKPRAQEQLKTSQSVNNLAGAQQQPQQQQKQQQQQQQNRQPINKRLEIIKEFVDTENTHTDRLRLLDELFYRPLKEEALMSAEQLRSVFSCHRTLYKIHRQIYRTLMSASYNMCAEPMIGAALLEIFEGELKRRLERAACSFCAAQSTNSELLNKLTRRDTKVGEFIARVTSQQMVGRLGIKDLLASCFQRLTKYPLLLENLLKATPQAAHAEPDEEGLDESERNSRRMLAIGLAEEREFIGRALQQSRQILVKVNESVKVATSNKKLKEIWKRTDKYPGVPLVDISKQQVLHEGQLTLRLSKRSFDVYVLLLTDYLIILTREGQDKYRLKFFTPDGKSSSSSSSAAAGGAQQSVYSPVFVIDEHLSTRDAATDENGFYLLCKRKDDSRIYEFASRSPADRIKWRDRIQLSIEHQMSRSANRRPSCESTTTKSSSEISAALASNNSVKDTVDEADETAPEAATNKDDTDPKTAKDKEQEEEKIEGTISYVEDDGIVMPNKMESSCAQVDQAIQVTLMDVL